MSTAGIRLGFAVVLAAMAGACSPPRGIDRWANLDGNIELSCVERGVRAAAGLSEVDGEIVKAGDSMAYQARGITDVLPVHYVTVGVERSDDAVHFTLFQTFDRLQSGGVSKERTRVALAVMKRVEASIASACRIDFADKIQMWCPPDIPCEAAA